MSWRCTAFSCVVAGALCFSAPAPASEVAADNAIIDTAQAIKRPSVGALEAILGTSGNQPGSLEGWVKRLDTHDLGLMPRGSLEWLDDQEEVIRLIHTATRDLPRLTPMRERTLLFLVRLQVPMLEIYASQRNPELSAALRDRRTRRSVLDPERHRIFGDIRDVYVANFYFALRDIGRTYQLLGIPADPMLQFPAGMDSVSELEAFFCACIRSLIERVSG